MTDNNTNPIVESEQSSNHFNHDEEDVLYDTYLILYDYGYTHEDLAPLRHAVAHLTMYDGYSLVIACDEMLDDE